MLCIGAKGMPRIPPRISKGFNSSAGHNHAGRSQKPGKICDSISLHERRLSALPPADSPHTHGYCNAGTWDVKAQAFPYMSQRRKILRLYVDPSWLIYSNHFSKVEGWDKALRGCGRFYIYLFALFRFRLRWGIPAIRG